jgi:hypothetical protein
MILMSETFTLNRLKYVNEIAFLVSNNLLYFMTLCLMIKISLTHINLGLLKVLEV